MQAIKIKAAASLGGAKLILASGAMALLLMVSLLWVNQLQLWQGLAFVAAGLGMFAGWAKLAEPAYFLQMDDLGVQYRHRNGNWTLPWQSFLYSGIPQYEQRALAYIGFKVTDYDSFLQHLPLRFAVRIMSEQRALYIEAVRQGCESGRCASELLVEGEHFNTSKQQYTGIKAAFAYRMQRLSAQTGFDLFVPVTMSETDTQQLCQQINQARLQLVQNTVT